MNDLISRSEPDVKFAKVNANRSYNFKLWPITSPEHKRIQIRNIIENTKVYEINEISRVVFNLVAIWDVYRASVCFDVLLWNIIVV